MTTLQPRESQALQWAASGASRRETADRMGVTGGAVKHLLDRAVRRLNAVNVPHAVAVAARSGLLDLTAIPGGPVPDTDPADQLLADSEAQGQVARDTDAGRVWEVLVTVMGPTSADAQRWAGGIRDMVVAEFSDSMRLTVAVRQVTQGSGW